MPDPPFAGEWLEEDTGLPAGGPRRWWRRIGDGQVAISGPAAKVASELEGLRRGADHPACPRLVDASDGWLHLERLGPPPTEALEAVRSWPAEAVTREGPLGELLPPCAVNPRKALRKLGARKVDRTLDRPASHRVLEGPSLGGVHGGWLRTTERGVVALRWSRFEEAGRPDLDRAATAWHEGGFASDLALLPHLLEEAVLGGDEEARAEALERFRELATPEPAQVVVHVAGAPSWLDTRRWSGPMAPAEARRVMHQLGGMSVAGQQLFVRVHPPVRKGRGSPHREPRSSRRRRLFSRWFEGIQADDEGLLSATGEALARDFVRGLEGRVLDGTCGIGSLAIAAAQEPGVEGVLAVDTHPGRLEMAGHNARIYGVELELRRGSVLDVLWEPHDALILDPPWGGRDYDRAGMGVADLDFPLAEVLERTRAPVRLKLPRSFRVEQLPGGPWRFRAAVDGRGVLKFLVAER